MSRYCHTDQCQHHNTTNALNTNAANPRLSFPGSGKQVIWGSKHDGVICWHSWWQKTLWNGMWTSPTQTGVLSNSCSCHCGCGPQYSTHWTGQWLYFFQLITNRCTPLKDNHKMKLLLVNASPWFQDPLNSYHVLGHPRLQALLCSIIPFQQGWWSTVCFASRPWLWHN